jgi:hypothetical protein
MWRRTSEPEQFAPELSCEHGVVVTDDGSQQAMEPNDVSEEGVHYRCHRVGMAEWNEMGVPEKHVHQSENHLFTADLGHRLNEIHGDISPYGG